MTSGDEDLLLSPAPHWQRMLSPWKPGDADDRPGDDRQLRRSSTRSWPMPLCYCVWSFGDPACLDKESVRDRRLELIFSASIGLTVP